MRREQVPVLPKHQSALVGAWAISPGSPSGTSCARPNRARRLRRSAPSMLTHGRRLVRLQHRAASRALDTSACPVPARSRLYCHEVLDRVLDKLTRACRTTMRRCIPTGWCWRTKTCTAKPLPTHCRSLVHSAAPVNWPNARSAGLGAGRDSLSPGPRSSSAAPPMPGSCSTTRKWAHPCYVPPFTLWIPRWCRTAQFTDFVER
jgi:hypothetical protein